METQLPPVTAHRLGLALKMASRGLGIFPLVPGSKTPYYDEGIRVATTDPAIISAWFRERPEMNYGCLTTDFVVLDVDVKHGAPGLKSLEGLRPLPETLTVHTPSGGIHFFFGLAYCGAADIAAGINVRSNNGYVVGAGCKLDGHEDLYRIDVDTDIAPIPTHILMQLKPVGQRVELEFADNVEIDSDEGVARATAWLEGKDGVPHGGRNGAAFAAAAKVREYGISEGKACDLLLTRWNRRNVPPLSKSEIATVVGNAYRYAQNSAGAKCPEVEFGDVELPPLPAKQAKAETRPAFDLAKAMRGTAARWVGKTPERTKWIVDRYMPEGAVTLLVSAGGRGKSFIAQQAMTSIAAGKPFLGLDVEPGEAIGLFCEDDENELHREGLGVGFDDVADKLRPIPLVGEDVALFRNGELTPLLETLENCLAERPGTKLLVLDGVSFMFQGVDYDRGQVTRFVAALSAIALRYRLAILLLHHESKTSASNDTHAAAGSTAWLNACRSVLKLDKPRAKDGDASSGPVAERVIRHIKSNKGPLLGDLMLRHDGKVFAALGTDPVRDRACVDATVALVRTACASGVNLSPHAQAREQYAPRWLTASQVDTDFSQEEFARALRTACGGMIVRALYTPRGKSDTAERYEVTQDHAPAPEEFVGSGANASSAPARGMSGAAA